MLLGQGSADRTEHVLEGQRQVWARQEGNRTKDRSCDSCCQHVVPWGRNRGVLSALLPRNSRPKCACACRYLSDHGNVRLLQAVRRTLRPGTRVASFYFPVAGWEQQLQHTSSTDGLNVFVYKAP